MSINKKKEVLRLDIKRNTAHYKRMLSVTQKKNFSQYKKDLLQRKESLSSIRREALFDVRKRLLQVEKGVSSFDFVYEVVACYTQRNEQWRTQIAYSKDERRLNGGAGVYSFCG